MSLLKEKLQEKIAIERPRTEKLLKEYGNVKVDEVTIGQIIGGMRDIKSLVTDISYLDPYEGIRFRGLTIPEVLEKLPKVPGAEMPYVEGFYYFLLTGDLPTENEVNAIHEEFNSRKQVPDYVFKIIKSMPIDSHPMTMFATAIMSMQKDSIFAKKYHEGVKKTDYWQYYFEDALNLLAKLPEIAAFIYRLKYRNGDIIPPDPNLDFGGNFAHMMGIAKPYDDISRLYFILHSDHESGNVSAHTGHLVASALSDMYYAISAMLNGLAGPLHGLANEEVLRWLHGVYAQLGGKIPTEEEMKKFVNDTLDAGKVIPGFGHAVLRKTDPRYMAQREFCLKHLPDDPLFKYVDLLFKVVPDILLARGKAKNPWPNVDAQSGVIQWYYGVKEYDFYTVLFGIGRSLGVTANIVWARALGYPIERPKSLTTKMLEDIAFGKK
ncbi:MAG: citrate (Si)-synthase [Stygiobacter sp.]|uniref:citrate synthase (unknown stereospecificity) n=1 Tax=Stygiobacter electus TaxID=3032292 RepID=A0AAE3TBX4_9BACT|nr:citrate (Si)-synthase [Stygiobacter electus]MDF1611803.1 citrate (Si)-synthase [Stygiobacter electus]